jgi:hypothetical protein
MIIVTKLLIKQDYPANYIYLVHDRTAKLAFVNTVMNKMFHKFSTIFRALECLFPFKERLYIMQLANLRDTPAQYGCSVKSTPLQLLKNSSIYLHIFLCKTLSSKPEILKQE